MLKFNDANGKEYTMHFHHSKELVPANPNKDKSQPHKRPRHTICLIKDNGNVIAEGKASCCPLDNFSYLTGRKWALTRALESKVLDRETRRNAWHKMLKL